jgi:hypothetical protein
MKLKILLHKKVKPAHATLSTVGLEKINHATEVSLGGKGTEVQ